MGDWPDKSDIDSIGIRFDFDSLSVAKEEGVYNLYVGKIMTGPCIYDPIVSTDYMATGSFTAVGSALAKYMI